MTKLASRAFAFLRAYSKDRRGASAIIFAVTLPAMVGLIGMGTEVGYWYMKAREIQTAADMAAMAAAYELRDEQSQASALSSANTEAADNGWDSSIGVLTLNVPPTTGSYSADLSAEVILTENRPRLFSALFANGDQAITTRAVATSTPGGPACILALDPFAEGAITVIGNASVALDACRVHSNSGHTRSAVVSGSATMTAPCIGAAGWVDSSSGLTLTDPNCPKPLNKAGVIDDPYSSLSVPLNPSTCSAAPKANKGKNAGTPVTITPGRYCGLNLNGDFNFDPGVYIIDGGNFGINAGANVYGDDVTFILTNDAFVSFNGSASIELHADSGGSYPGVLIYGDRNNDSSIVNHVNGDSTSIFEGVVYAPSQKISFNGNGSGPVGCSHIIGRMVHVSGNASFGNNCSAAGATAPNVPGKVVLVE